MTGPIRPCEEHAQIGVSGLMARGGMERGWACNSWTLLDIGERGEPKTSGLPHRLHQELRLVRESAWTVVWRGFYGSY